ncbi:hypothetical protein [Polaribacter sp. Hel_I_88]|uniref:hypothetical protein n=1 Tax=Polaribacter sp. Hel_I_88 TaxID=1250006 RepID=UPI00047D69F1|nr:hypothetical protein [Polaribacter sp. Hel_I_88]
MENNLESKSTKELQGSLKGLKIISIALIIVIGLLLSITIYGMLFKDNNATFIALFVVGVSCAAILPVQFISMKKIKTELNSREK